MARKSDDSEMTTRTEPDGRSGPNREKGEGDTASVVADVDQPDPGDINPLAPPINTEAGA